MFRFVKSGLLAVGGAVALCGTQAISHQAFADDPPPPKAAELANPTGEHHVLNSSPTTVRRHADPADRETMTRRRRYTAPYVYQPYYYYYYNGPAPGVTGMYFPDPGSYAYGYSADGAGYGF